MNLSLRNLVSSLKSIPAVITGFSKEEIEDFISSSGPKGEESNYSLAQLKELLASTDICERTSHPKNISVAGLDLFSIQVRRDSDRISYLEFNPISVMRDYLKK